MNVCLLPFTKVDSQNDQLKKYSIHKCNEINMDSAFLLQNGLKPVRNKKLIFWPLQILLCIVGGEGLSRGRVRGCGCCR